MAEVTIFFQLIIAVIFSIIIGMVTELEFIESMIY